MSSADELAARYGKARTASRGGERWPWVAGGAMLLLVLGFWAATNLLGGPGATASAEIARFRVTSPSSVEVDYLASVRPGSPLACVLEARSDRHGAVGWSIIELPPADSETRGEQARIVTVGEASTVLVRECWVPG